MKHFGLKLLIFSGSFFIAGTTNAVFAQAKTNLPSRITHHVWYRTTTGTEGGFHDRTVFKGNTAHLKSYGHKFVWRFKKIKHTSKNVYYARNYWSKKKYDQVKIVIRSAHKFDIIPKYSGMSRQAYSGNENYGAIIFKR